ncbi:MAG: hypothetical protein ACOCWW_04320, partial [Bacteroidota bacterium]
MERETGRSTVTGFDVEKTAKRAENGTLPDNFNKWDAKTEKGDTIAYIAAKAGKLPDKCKNDPEILKLTNEYGETVAHEMAEQGHKFSDPEILKLANE